jgi:hypothetical protein
MSVNIPPTKLSLGLSGFPPPGPNRFRWNNGQLTYRLYDRTKSEEDWIKAVVPTPMQWQEFWSICDAIDVWSWPFDISNINIIDGLEYVLELEVGDRAVRSKGQACDYQPGFSDKVRSLHQALQAMTGFPGKDFVEFFLAHVADVNTRGHNGSTQLDLAARLPQTEVVELLLAHGANVNAKANDGRTPLHWASHSNAELLLAHGADINAKDNCGWTVLHWSAWSGNKDKAELFLNRGADVNAKTTNGWTPFRMAAQQGYEDVVELLLTYGADVNAKDNDSRTALH